MAVVLSERNYFDAYENLLEAARSPYPLVRNGAITALGRIRTDFHTDHQEHDNTLREYLIAALSDPVQEVRIAALNSPRSVNDPFILEVIAQIITDTDNPTRIPAIKALNRTYVEPLAHALIGLLHDSNEEVRIEAIRAIGRAGIYTALEELSIILNSDTIQVRVEALKVIRILDHPESLIPLTMALDQDDDTVRLAALKGIYWIFSNRHYNCFSLDQILISKIRELISDNNRQIRFFASMILAERRDLFGIGILFEGFGYIEDQEQSELQSFLTSLFQDPCVKKILPDLYDIVRDALQHGSMYARWTALGCIEASMDPVFMNLLIGVAKHSVDIEDGVQGAIFRNPNELLIVSDGDIEIRTRALRILANFHDPQAILPFISALNDPKLEVRNTAKYAIQSVQDPAALGILSHYLTDQRIIVRESVVEAIGRIGIKEAIYLLYEATEDPAFSIRRIAVLTLASRNEPCLAKGLCELLRYGDNHTREQAIGFLEGYEEFAILRSLSLAIYDPGTKIRVKAEVILNRLKKVYEINEKDYGPGGIRFGPNF